MTEIQFFLFECLNQKPLIQELSIQDETLLQYFITEHKIEGYLQPYIKNLKSPDLIEHIEYTCRKNMLQNLILKDCFLEIRQACLQQKIPPPIPLKGIDLIQWLLPLSARPMTDIDIYTSESQLQQLTLLLKSLGYTLVPEDKWFANAHKTTFTNSVGTLDITLEVHTRLLYNEPDSFSWVLQSTAHGTTLSLTDQIIYLSYHLAHQHTFLKLFWLMDIVRLTQHCPALWTKDLFQRAQQLGCYQAVLAVAYVINSFFNLKIDLPSSDLRFSHRLSWDFLVEPMGNKWRYYTLKHMIKDSLKDSLAYDIGWLQNKWHQFVDSKSSIEK